jgi:hypothetical protein
MYQGWPFVTIGLTRAPALDPVQPVAPRPQHAQMPPGFEEDKSAFTKITLGKIGNSLLAQRRQNHKKEQEREQLLAKEEQERREHVESQSSQREETPVNWSVPKGAQESSPRKCPEQLTKARRFGERRGHASWQEYKEMQTLAPSLTTIGERDVLREFFDKDMLLRSQGRFIIHPPFSVEEWLDQMPPVRPKIERILNRLWKDGRLKRKTFRSMRKDLRFFMRHGVYSKTFDGGDEPRDFMRLLLRLLERKRGEAIVVELEKGG